MTNMNVYSEASATQQTILWWDYDLQKSFFGLLPALYYRSTLNDHCLFVIGMWY